MIPEKSTEIPFDPRDSSAKFQRLQELLRSGMSYRAITRATGVTKKDLKEIQIRKTGRFFFAHSKTLKGNQVLLAEQYNPITNELTSVDAKTGIPNPVFASATNAWAWLEGQRFKLWVESYQPPTTPLFSDVGAIDYTPASH